MLFMHAYIVCTHILPFSQILEHVSSEAKASYMEAKAEYNVEKNRFPDKLPS